MDLDELATWIVYLEQFDPPAEMRAFWRMGQICATVANAHSRSGGFEPSDFMPKRDQGATPEEAQGKLMSWCANVGEVRMERR